MKLVTLIKLVKSGYVDYQWRIVSISSSFFLCGESYEESDGNLMRDEWIYYHSSKWGCWASLQNVNILCSFKSYSYEKMSCIKILTRWMKNLAYAPDFKDPVSARLLLAMKQLCFYNVHVYLNYIAAVSKVWFLSLEESSCLGYDLILEVQSTPYFVGYIFL